MTITDRNFQEEVAKSDIPVIVDIWSATCAPCKKLEPIIVGLAKTYAGRVKVCEMSVEKSPQTCGRLNIRSTPTVLYIKDGKVIEAIPGFRGSLYHEQTVAELFDIPKKAGDPAPSEANADA